MLVITIQALRFLHPHVYLPIRAIVNHAAVNKMVQELLLTGIPIMMVFAMQTKFPVVPQPVHVITVQQPRMTTAPARA